MSTISVNFLSLILLFEIISCCPSRENINFKKSGKWSLSLTRLVDLNVSPNTKIDYCNFNGINTIICLNNNTLRYFDIERNIVYYSDTIILPEKFYPDAIRCISPEFICISTKMPYKLVCINVKDKTKKIYSLNPNKRIAKVPPAPDLSKCGTELMKYPFLFLSGVCIGEGAYNKSDRPPGISLNLITHEYKYFMDFPSIYYKKNWGGMYYRMPFITGDLKNEIIFSFPASHELYIFNTMTGESQSRPGGSSYIEEILPFSSDLNINTSMIKEELIKYYFTNPSYGFITYDRFRDIYYRIAEHGNSEYEKSNVKFKPFSVIIFDKNFQFLGETYLPQMIYSQQLFVSKENIFIPYFNKESNTRGVALFNVLIDK